MNYFVGSLYGNYEAYQTIKEKLKLKENDKLWILGDVLDGNDVRPQDSLNIIKDIKRNSNIELILGDHEFAHVMRFISKTNKDSYESWKSYLLGLSENAEELIWYFEEEIDEDDEETLFSYLIGECEITKLIKIGDNYFYITHGFPAMFDGNLTKWQFSVTTGEITEKNVFQNIKSDPTLSKDQIKGVTEKNTFVICAHQDMEELNKGSIYHNAGTFLIGSNISESQIAVLGIDAAGYFLKNIVF